MSVEGDMVKIREMTGRLKQICHLPSQDAHTLLLSYNFSVLVCALPAVSRLPADPADFNHSSPPTPFFFFFTFLLLFWEAELYHRKCGIWVGVKLGFSSSWVTLRFLMMKWAYIPLCMVAAGVSSHVPVACTAYGP